jgi:hypothetical protein
VALDLDALVVVQRLDFLGHVVPGEAGRAPRPQDDRLLGGTGREISGVVWHWLRHRGRPGGGPARSLPAPHGPVRSGESRRGLWWPEATVEHLCECPRAGLGRVARERRLRFRHPLDPLLGVHLWHQIRQHRPETGTIPNGRHEHGVVVIKDRALPVIHVSLMPLAAVTQFDAGMQEHREGVGGPLP